MIDAMLNFLQMGGYGFYIWGAYGIVGIFLFIQWWMPWRRWRKYLHIRKSFDGPK